MSSFPCQLATVVLHIGNTAPQKFIITTSLFQTDTSCPKLGPKTVFISDGKINFIIWYILSYNIFKNKATKLANFSHQTVNEHPPNNMFCAIQPGCHIKQIYMHNVTTRHGPKMRGLDATCSLVNICCICFSMPAIH